MVARHANINNVLAMRLTRMDDARGRPFMVHLARCNRWPRGLDLGMMDSGNRGLTTASALSGRVAAWMML